MGKKKTTNRPVRRKTNSRKRRKKTKKTAGLFSNLKNIVLGGILTFLILISLQVALDFLDLRNEKNQDEKEKQTHPGIEFPVPSQEQTLPEKQTINKKFTFPPDTEIPQLLHKRTEQVIRHEGYTVSYNSDYKIANWVAYELTEEEVKTKKTERTNKFVPDPAVKGATALNEDYSRTGYDRGHLAPAGDMRWSAKAMRESFYFSNICPQVPGLNRGIWKDLEEQVRLWAVDYGEVLVITGPVIEDEMQRLGKNRVGVPKVFYKVISANTGNKPVGIGFLFENKDYKKTSIRSGAVPIDSVEKVTGINFFPQLPLEVQKEMECKIEWEYWGL